MTTPQHARFLADRSGDYLRSYSIDVHLARHAIELGQMDRADRLIKQAQVSLWLATDCIDQFNAVMDELETRESAVQAPNVVWLPVPRKAPETVLTGLTAALIDIADRTPRFDLDNLPSDVEPGQ